MTEPYILGNKAAWEEAFDRRAADWGADVGTRVGHEPYAFFNADTADILKTYDLRGKRLLQLCCNNGRELLSLTATAGAAEGVGIDIAENQVRFANEQAAALGLPCRFAARNVLELGDEYAGRFDFLLITIGALCWFRDLTAFFRVAARCLRPGAAVVINETHPLTNMLAYADEPEYDPAHPLNCCHSYFEHEWIGNAGMSYMTGGSYASKTFTDYTHPLGEIVGALCAGGFVVTGLHEYDYDISGSAAELDRKGFPLSMTLEARRS